MRRIARTATRTLLCGTILLIMITIPQIITLSTGAPITY